MAAACSSDIDTSNLQTNSSAAQPSYDAIVDKMRELARRSDLVQVLTYGKTLRGKDLYMVRIGKAAAGNPGKPMVVFSEATHGNEFLNVVTGLTEGLVNDSKSGALKTFFYDKLGVMLIVPVVNVDGYEYHRTTSPAQKLRDGGPDQGNSWGRMNANRIDLNRDFAIASLNFAGFEQPESKAYAQAVANQLSGGYKLVTTIDYHCCISGGVLAYPYAYSNSMRLTSENLKRHLNISDIMKRSLPSVSAHPSAAAMGYIAKGFSSDYFFETYGSASFTYEGQNGAESGRVDKHVRAWTDILEAAAKSAPDQVSSSSSPSQEQSIVQDHDIKLALGDGSANTALIAIATSTGTSAMLCRGTFSDCAKPSRQIESELNQAVTKNGRLVFQQSPSELGITLQPNQTYSVLTKTSNSNIWRGVMIRFEAK